MKLRNVYLNNYIHNKDLDFKDYLNKLRLTKKLDRKNAHFFRDSYEPKEWNSIRNIVINSSDLEFNKFLNGIEKTNIEILNKFKIEENNNNFLKLYVLDKGQKYNINGNQYRIYIDNQFGEIRFYMEISKSLTFLYVATLKPGQNDIFSFKNGGYYDFSKSSSISNAYIYDHEVDEKLKSKFQKDFIAAKLDKGLQSLIDTLKSFYN